MGKEKVIEKRISEIYEFILAYIAEHKYVPSYREIGEGVGLISSSSVQVYISLMVERGMLATDAAPGTPRAFRVVGYEYTKIKEEELPPLDEPVGQMKSVPSVPCVKGKTV